MHTVHTYTCRLYEYNYVYIIPQCHIKKVRVTIEYIHIDMCVYVTYSHVLPPCKFFV